MNGGPKPGREPWAPRFRSVEPWSGREGEISHRLEWLLFFRLAVAALGIALVLVLEGGRARASAPYAIFIAVAALDLVYMAVLRRVRDLARFAALQIALDWAAVSALVYATGGVYSFAAILYFAPILAASLCVSGRAAVLVASAASIALAGVQIGYYLAESQSFSLPFFDLTIAAEGRARIGRDASYLIAQALAFHLVAGLSSWLAQELRRVKILYSDILENMAEGLVAIDADCRIVVVNDEARRLLRYDRPGSLTGIDFREVFRRKADRALLDCLLSPEPVQYEVEVETRAGEWKSIEVKTSVLRDDRGIVRGTVGIFTDLTLRKQFEQAEKRAERLEGIEALALGIAHEIRNPLASIRGCVQELGRLDYLGEDERQLARIVCRESDRLDAIVAEFLRFARLKPPAIGELDLSALLREVAVLLRGRVPGGRVAIEVDAPPRAPIRGDPQLLTQVLLNLGINAIEAIEGSGTVRLRCRETSYPRTRAEGEGRRVRDEAAAWEVAVVDTGRGIAPDDLGRVFTPFFTTKPGGTGLGMPIAERIVKSHGGRILVESERGKGTSVRVILPAEARLAEAAAKS